MPEPINDHKVYSLLEITESIHRAFQKWYPGSFWILAEMNKLNHYPHSGHCYPDLVERREGKVVAQIRANIWADDYARINQQFLNVLKEPLKDGINILFQAKVSFHSMYGLSLHISYIDPSYTLGDLEREKQQTISRLREEGIYGKNKSLELPILPQRIAVISVETSRGYADFKSIVEGNQQGYYFFLMLFPALLQGDKAGESILARLDEIRKVLQHFDLVAIIRGGGGDVGLSVYNQYKLAREIALFPIPVLTGIGHSTNETVAEMVAWKNAITPTDLGTFLISRFHQFAFPVYEAQKKLLEISVQKLELQKLKLSDTMVNLISMTRNIFSAHKYLLKKEITVFRQATFRQTGKEKLKFSYLQMQLKKYALQSLRINENNLGLLKEKLYDEVFEYKKRRENEIGNLEKQISFLNPSNILRRGFSITRSNGKVITDVSALQSGEIETILFSGKIFSQILTIENRTENE